MMERLTGRNKLGQAYYERCFKEPCFGCGTENCNVCDYFTETLCEKLADYEDLNLTPTQLQEIDKLYVEKCKEVSKLEVYKDVINCLLNNEDVEIWIVWKSLEISDDVVSSEFLKNNAEEVGESIFFSQEEAEKSLAEMESEDR